jgi:hypothetical protein
MILNVVYNCLVVCINTSCLQMVVGTTNCFQVPGRVSKGDNQSRLYLP